MNDGAICTAWQNRMNQFGMSGYLTLKSICKADFSLRKNNFACLLSVHNTISLSRHEQVCL